MDRVEELVGKPGFFNNVEDPVGDLNFLNYKTFPKHGRWQSGDGTVWIQVGVTVWVRFTSYVLRLRIFLLVFKDLLITGFPIEAGQ